MTFTLPIPPPKINIKSFMIKSTVRFGNLTPTSSILTTIPLYVHLAQTVLEVGARPRTPTSQPKPATVAFISGPVSADQAYFEAHYRTRIRKAISQNHEFVLGSREGIDFIALQYLHLQGVPAKHIRLYLSASEAANPKIRRSVMLTGFEQAGGQVVVVEGGSTERDEAMTRASHYDILSYRTEEENKIIQGASYRKRLTSPQRNEIRRAAGVGLAWTFTC